MAPPWLLRGSRQGKTKARKSPTAAKVADVYTRLPLCRQNGMSPVRGNATNLYSKTDFNANQGIGNRLKPRLTNTSHACKYMPRLANTSPQREIQAQTCQYKPDMQTQAQTCKYKPRVANTSQTCKYMPRLTNTSPDLQIQAQTCKYKPSLQIHAQACKYKPRPSNPSPDLQIQAQTSLIYVYYKCYTRWSPAVPWFLDSGTQPGTFQKPIKIISNSLILGLVLPMDWFLDSGTLHGTIQKPFKIISK